jgi:hypothetical protein
MIACSTPPRCMATMGNSETAATQSLQEDTLRLWNAYEYLRANDLASVSATSRLLRTPDLALLGSRLADELVEMAGVLTGEHRHTNPEEDLVLEGSQVCYWVYISALALNLTFEDLNPARNLAAVGAADLNWVLEDIHGTASHARNLAGSTGKTEQALLLARALRAVGSSCASRGVDVLGVVKHDLRQMSARPYMSSYLDGSGKG